MNILELCLSPGLGGLELYVFRSAQALAHNHSVFAVLNEKGKLADLFTKNPEIGSVHLRRSSKLLPLINARKLSAIIDLENIDAIHMHWGDDLALAALAKMMSTKRPALIYTRQMKITRYKHDFYHRMLYRQLDLILTITKQLEAEATKFLPVSSGIIKTLYYGVDNPQELLDPEDRVKRRAQLGFLEQDFVIGLLGRLELSKGQHLLIEALQLAKSEQLELKALIIGHEMIPGYRKTLQDLAKSKQVDECIIFEDFVPEPQQLMQLCDCIALTTQEETFGLVLPEAMKCGIAVIGSDKGGVPEIITHEKTGLLFESWNASSLYKQISRLYTEPDLRKDLARQGKAEADRRFNNIDHFAALEKHILEAAR